MIEFSYYGEDCHVLCCDLYPEQEWASTLPFKRMVDPQEKHWRVDKLRLDCLEETALTSSSADSGLTCFRGRCLSSLNSLQSEIYLFALSVDSTVATCSTERNDLRLLKFVEPVWRGLCITRLDHPVAILRK